MQTSIFSVPAFPYHKIILHHDCPHKRIGIDEAFSSLGQLHGHPHIDYVLFRCHKQLVFKFFATLRMTNTTKAPDTHISRADMNKI